MRIFEPHAHMSSRVTHDYERMAQAGVEMIVEPAFWLGEPRKRAGTFFDYYDLIINYETRRAAAYGIDHYVTLSVNPREANNKALADEVLKELPRYLDNPRVVGVGEIGFDAITELEEEFLRKQIDMAREHELPLLVHSPHLQKYEGIRKILDILIEMKFDMEWALIDHSVEETTPMIRKEKAWCGHTVYPMTKLSPERTARIILENGYDKMMINSSVDWGPSDPLMVYYTVEELKKRGAKEKDLEKLVWDNPWNFFSKSGRLK